MKTSILFTYLFISIGLFAQTDVVEKEAKLIFNQAFAPGKQTVRNIGSATENIYSNIKSFEKINNRDGEPTQNIDGQESTFIYKIGSDKATTLKVSYNITFYGQEMLVAIENPNKELLDKVKEIALTYMAENFEGQDNPMKYTMEPYFIEVHNVITSYFEQGQYLFSVMVYKNL
jgi:hypothetical protein